MTEEHIMAPQEQAPEPEDYKDKYLRLLAELDNTRKRMQKERQEMTRFAVENFICDMLGPIDNLENALKSAENLSSELKNWAFGFTMILNQFKEVIEGHGVSSFISEGEQFNPELHYAIETEEMRETPTGTILKEYVKGYRSKERTVRPARVKVAKAPQDPVETTQEGE